MKYFASLLLYVALLVGCSDEGPKDYIKVIGGGLTFNYRYSQATMVVVVRAMTPLPEGGTVEALFDIPGETVRELVTRPVIQGKLTYKMESKYLLGIKKDVPLKVTLRAIDAKGIVLDTEETAYTSDVDQDTLPSKPLVDPSKPNYIPQLENL